ncbi:MAG: ADP-ribosylation factor-like protein [Candidatus Odinarchaeia archaeon]
MIHKIMIYHISGKRLLKSSFSEEGDKIHFDEKLFVNIINTTYQTQSKTSYLTISEYKICFKINGEIAVIIIGDIDDTENVLEEYSIRILKRYRLRYGDSGIEIPGDEITAFIEILNRLITQPTITLKVLLIGEPATGKTSILKILNNEPVPERYIPSVDASGNDFTDITDEAIVYIWDLPGREEHRWLWERYIRGADILLIVTDSTTPNMLNTMESWSSFREEVPDNIKICGLANMQDKKNALEPEVVGNILGFKTYPLSSKSLDERENIIKVLREICEDFILKGVETTSKKTSKSDESEILNTIMTIKEGLLNSLPPNHPIFVGINSWIDKLKENPNLNENDIKEFNKSVKYWRKKMEELMNT